MDNALTRTANQFIELFRSMTPSQRATLVVVPLLLVGALAMLLFRSGTSSYVPLSWGKVFTTEELIHAEQALRDAGLGEFRREGAQLLAPAGEVERYNAALLANGGLPSEPLSEFEKQLDKRFSIWTGAAQLQAMKDIALEKEINRILQAVPEIQTASVKWARSGGSGRFPRGETRVTATVSVRPRPGKEISPAIVRSLQDAVGAMIPDLRPQDVTVFDIAASKSYARDDASDPQGNEFLTRTRQFQEEFRREIRNALSYIPGVLVTVKVDLDNLKSSVERQQLLDPKRAVSVQATESTRMAQTTGSRPSAEPGQTSNMPRALSTAAGSSSAQSLSEQNTQSLSVPSIIWSDKEFMTAMPQAVQVAVAIPDDYYRAIAAQQAPDGDASATGGNAAATVATNVKTPADVERDVKATVAAAIGATEDRVTVTSYVRVPAEAPEVEPPLWSRAGDLASQWGGAIALALFALWALRMASRVGGAGAKVEEQSSATLPGGTIPLFDHEVAEAPPPSAPEMSLRDRLQVTVRDNPEMAAALLSKWIQAAK